MPQSSSESARGRLLEIIERDRQDLIDLCLDLGNTASPHARERIVAEKVVGWLRAAGIRAWPQPITAESANAVALIPGTRGRGARSLIMDAHMDIGLPLRPDASERIRKIHGVWVENDLMYGLGVVNDKAQLACFMIAARALLKAGIALEGDLLIAGVAFETGAPSVGEIQGIEAPGEGFGTWWLVNRGVTADYALIGETSGFGIIAAECGELGLLVRVSGRFVYTPRLERPETLRAHPNTIVGMAHIVTSLEEWSVDYERRARVDTPAGTIIPRAQVMAIHGSPAETSVELDIRLAPGADPRAIEQEVADYLRRVDVDYEVSAFQWSRGYVARGAEPLSDAVRRAHDEVFHTAPASPPTAEVSMWRDMNMFNEVGIPSICYGPPRQYDPYSDTHDRAVRLDDLVNATKVYALTALNICGETQQ